MENKHKLSINQWAPEDRPREKMIEKGAAALSDAELLAILIGSGNTEESAVELMRRLLLSCDNNLNALAKWEVCDYSRFKGMGPAKSITVMAALELGKRRKLQNIRERLRITCSKDIYEIFQPLMCDLAQDSAFPPSTSSRRNDRCTVSPRDGLEKWKGGLIPACTASTVFLHSGHELHKPSQSMGPD